MSNKKDTNNNTELITYSIIGGAIISTFIPTYIPIVLCGGGLMASLYGINSILSKYKDADDMNFVSKENIKYFNKK